MSLKLPQGFSFFRTGGPSNEKKGGSTAKHKLTPSLKLHTDKEVYRPGDSVTATIELCSPGVSQGETGIDNSGNNVSSLLVDNLSFEIKGIEKLDTQWFATQKALPGSKQKRGEHLFLDCSAPSIISKVIVSTGSSKTYIIRAELPTTLPPSYKGTTIRYIYYVRSTISFRWLLLENGHHDRDYLDDLTQLEARAPLQIWVTQKSNNILNEGTLPAPSIEKEIYWREKDADSEWTRANEMPDGLEEGYDSSRDEISSVSSYNPTKGNTDFAFRSSLSLQSMITRISNNEAQYSVGERSGFPSYMPLSQLSVAEVLDDSSGGLVSPQKKATYFSPSLQRKVSDSASSSNDVEAPSIPGHVEPTTSEGFIRGRSYNIRIEDKVLLRFSPRNPDSTYFFGDLIGGTLTFFHGGARRCLEVSITLETSETIGQQYIHPSRRSSPIITKVQSDHHEVVADLVQTSFLFSVPIDGPMSFSTPYVSVQWALRFEFFTTPKHVDLTRYEHPLLIPEREKGDWVLPITVYAPLSRTQTAQSRNEKSLSLETSGSVIEEMVYATDAPISRPVSVLFMNPSSFLR